MRKDSMSWGEALALAVTVMVIVLALVGCGMHVEAMRPPGTMPADVAQAIRGDCYLRAMQAFPNAIYSPGDQISQRFWAANCLRLYGFQ